MGSDSDESPELRQRIPEPAEHENESENENEKDIISENEKDNMSEKNSDKEQENDNTPDEQPVLSCKLEPTVRVYRAVQQPSFITRQFRSVQNFFVELFEFILLFLTTLFNPMADVNVQVQEHQQRKAAREGRYFSNQSAKKRSSPFPGCGPSS